jgi:hypothetical protein
MQPWSIQSQREKGGKVMALFNDSFIQGLLLSFSFINGSTISPLISGFGRSGEEFKGGSSAELFFVLYLHLMKIIRKFTFYLVTLVDVSHVIEYMENKSNKL